MQALQGVLVFSLILTAIYTTLLFFSIIRTATTARSIFVVLNIYTLIHKPFSLNFIK